MGERLAMTPGDVSGHLTPLHLANGQRPALLLAMLNGGSVHCLPEADAGAFLGQLADELERRRDEIRLDERRARVARYAKAMREDRAGWDKAVERSKGWAG